ncbi:phytanoyl-CoA hydroxylase-interacting protein-like isoform X2 [Patella vulgata]|uniref:phytanoyl-CoA hydroxylase-interacting protein-like isoform X2 n=1 Tax=Patella vulgata TaxID=6465 RepID=UPI0024A8B31E|nr:phytanoyl-CoA hydroxylase-interacting protein-like isoform X2 [Patella vulgata]
MVEKSLYIGSTEIKITYNLFQINRIICAVENTENNETGFYFLNCTDSWHVDQNQQPPNTELRITIYGLRINEPKVILSNTIIINSPLHHMRLESHNKHGRFPSDRFTFLVATNGMNCSADQRVNEMTNKSSIIFKCEDVQLPINTEYHYIQIIQTTSSTNDVSSYNEYIELTTTYTNEIPCVNLPSREAVNYKIYKVSLSGNQYYVTKTSKKSQFITHNSKYDVHQFHDMALLFISGSGTMKIPYLYRNKPSYHPTIQEVIKTGVMTKYDKDNNGDQASSINHNIKGLFFSASMDKDTRQPQTSSFFGDYRILIPPEHLIPGLNLYFADFYCNHKAHYVTLVLTKPGSVEDVYCKVRLIKLDINDNKFLFHDQGFYYTTSDRKLWVEVLYTEDVHVDDMLSDGKLLKEITPTKGMGQSKLDGIPKNKSCKTCNLPKRPYSVNNSRYFNIFNTLLDYSSLY